MLGLKQGDRCCASNENTVMRDGDETIIYWQEVAEFGLGDGERHAFLNKP